MRKERDKVRCRFLIFLLVWVFLWVASVLNQIWYLFRCNTYFIITGLACVLDGRLIDFVSDLVLLYCDLWLC